MEDTLGLKQILTMGRMCRLVDARHITLNVVVLNVVVLLLRSARHITLNVVALNVVVLLLPLVILPAKIQYTICLTFVKHFINIRQTKS